MSVNCLSPLPVVGAAANTQSASDCCSGGSVCLQQMCPKLHLYPCSCAVSGLVSVHALCLPLCPCRIANLKEELEASRQRLEDEQQNEAQLARRAQALEEEAKAAGRQLQQAGVDATDFPSAAVALPESAADAQQAFPVGWGAAAATQAVAAPAMQQAAPTEAVAAKHRSRWAALLGSVDEQELTGAQDVAAGAAAAAAGPSGPGYDMSAVTKHVEEMAAQYVEKLTRAEAELQCVRSVWQRADDDLAEMRSSSSPRVSTDGSQAGAAAAAAAAAGEAPGSPRFMTASGRVGRQDFELMRLAPEGAPQGVAGSSYAAAEAEHGLAEPIAFAIELPAPSFGGGHVGNFPAGYRGPQQPRRGGGSYSQSDSSREGATAAQSQRGVAVVAASAVDSTPVAPQPAPGAERYTAAVNAFAALQRAAQQAAASSSPQARVSVRMVPETAASDSSYSSNYSSQEETGSEGSCNTDLA